jgi:3-deoxy-D-manno-oct-2-ulosonic acid (Kdo) hydroxylase
MHRAADDENSLAERLERGEVITFAPCPFALPAEGDLAFLCTQRTRGRIHKDLAYDPSRDAAGGYRYQSAAQARRLCAVLGQFAHSATAWLACRFPGYAASWQPERVSFRPDEEAVRKLRRTARNDLLHFDAFPSRPTRGRRILRLFVNVNATDPRVWVTSDTFANIFARYGAAAGLPGPADDRWTRRIRHGLLSLFQPGAADRTHYDAYMLRLHHFLKSCDAFQESAPRRFWHFPPGSAWLLFTDAVTHADLRGQYALERSFFIAPQALALPNESPLALLEKACGTSLLPRVA